MGVEVRSIFVISSEDSNDRSYITDLIKEWLDESAPDTNYLYVGSANDPVVYIDVEGDVNFYVTEGFIKLNEISERISLFKVTYVEPNHIEIESLINRRVQQTFKITSGRYKKRFFDIMSSDFFFIEACNFAIEKINAAEKANFPRIENFRERPQTSNVDMKAVYELILDDNETEFQPYLERGLSLRADFLEVGDDLLKYNTSVARHIVCSNALKIANSAFNPNAIDSLGYPPLLLCDAVRNNFPEMTELLVDKGWDPNVKFSGQTPLVMGLTLSGSAYNKPDSDEACLTLLSRKECDPNIIESGRGVTATSPLLEACIRDKPLVVKACIKAGAKPTKPCNRYSLSAATKTKNKSTVRYLIDEAGFKYFVNRHKPNGPDREKGWFTPYLYQPLLYAVINEWKDICEEILDANPQTINFMDLRNQTPISVAAAHGLLDMVKYLVELGADPHALDTSLYQVFEEDFMPWDKSWWTKWGPSHPLAEAAASGHLDVVKYLVELGADSRIAVTHSERELRDKNFIFRGRILHDVPAIELAEKFEQPHVVEFLRDIEKDLPVKRPPETW